jgi:hypothetical protein
MSCILKWENYEIDADPKHLEFNEVNLNQFLQNFGSKFSRIVQQSKELAVEYERRYHLKFVYFKDNDGGSDKLCEARCKADQELSDMKKIVEKADGFMRGMDKAYQSAISYGHNLRKEMEKLDTDIHFSTGFQGKKINEIDSQIEDIFSKIGKELKDE